MGNLCSKSANEPDHFSQPGRVLGDSSQAQSKPSSTPTPKKIISSTPGRTVGGLQATGAATGVNDPRSAAAKAAEERAAKAAKASGSGKLSSQLEAQKKQTRNELLNATSEQERQARTADANAEARNWN